MKDLISVIIPVYNVERYLDKCLESITKQTYKDLEIIVIDDGSTDNSGNICLKWSKLDKRIKVYHQENNGSANARNYGLNKSHGKYILFIDSDDYISECAIEVLVNEIEDNYLVGLILKNNSKKNKRIIYSTKEFLKLNLKTKNLGCGGCCGYLFERKKIDSLKFNENLYLLEDVLFLYEYLTKIEKIKYVNEYYFYNNNLNSITKGRNNLFGKINSILFFTQKIKKEIKIDLKLINNKKVFLLEKELRNIKDKKELEVLIILINDIKYSGISLRYHLFCFFINNKNILALFNYYKLRNKLKKLVGVL